MSPMTLLVAILAAASVLILFWAVFGGKSGDVNERLERYAAVGTPEKTTSKKSKDGGGVRQALAGTKAFTDFNRVVERRDFAANLARELARADLALKPSEFLAIRAVAIIGIPASCSGSWARRSCPAWATRSSGSSARVVGFWAPALLAEPPQEPAPQEVQQRPRRHHHAHRQRPPVGLLVPAGHRDGGPRDAAARSPPSSTASSARSTWACRSSRRWPTSCGASAPRTWS